MSQFGSITNLRLSRNKKTGASKHYAFVEFAEASTAEIVAKTMDNYLLFGHLLKCKLVPKSQVHDDLWQGANRRWKKWDQNKRTANQLKKPKTESTWTASINKENEKRAKRAQKLKEMGYDFVGPQLKDAVPVAEEALALEGTDAEAMKLIEDAPATIKVPGEDEAEAKNGSVAQDEDDTSKAAKGADKKAKPVAKKGKQNAKSKKAKA
jgi:nucleolar protein 15